MSRKIPYNHTRFDGGMTDSPRDTTDLTKFALIKHIDIYRDSSRMFVMPGYIDDMSIGGDADGMKIYDIRAINYLRSGLVVAVGTKADGTGSALFYKNAPTDAEWDFGTSGTPIEGTDNIAPHTWLAGTQDNTFWITTAGTTTYISRQVSGSITDKYATIIAAVPTNISKKLVTERSFLDASVQYVNKGGLDSGVTSIDGSTVTINAKTTDGIPDDIQSGNDVIGLATNISFPSRAQLLLWDSASLLIDQKNNFGSGRIHALGYPSNFWVGVVNEGLDAGVGGLTEQANGDASMSIKVASGGTTELLYRITGATNTNGEIIPIRGIYRDAMTFYARVPQDATPTTYHEGVWAVGKADVSSPLAISIPLDTGSLGVIESICNFGNHWYFIHGGDYSISRLDDMNTGTFDVPATIETLIYGAESPYQKELNGVSIVTEDLPSGASVVCKYRIDENSAWTTMGTSNTTGTRRHSFTKAAGVVIGKFQEIQFQFTLTGRIVVKNLQVVITETDNLPY
jgi:hypothetical protein